MIIVICLIINDAIAFVAIVDSGVAGPSGINGDDNGDAASDGVGL